MDRLSDFRNRMRVVAAVCTACCAAALTACSDDTDTNDAGRLPAGQYPITLTATVEGQTVTRATSDNTWEGTEEVALQVGGEVKKYTVAAGGALTAHSDNNPFYWTSITEQKTVGAWYPHSATRPASFTVQADQNTNSGEGFQQSDLLYTSQSITYNTSTNASNPPQLTFKHLPVKVVVNLKADTQNGVTEADVQNATVTLVNQALTSGAITYDDAALAAAPVSVAQAAAGNVITPKVSATATSGYQQTVQALLVPQQMQGKQFVKITVGSSIYYYVPKDNAANLEHGKQYTYNITVKKEKLEVTVSSSVSWTDEVTTGNAQAATFRITYGEGMTLATGDGGTLTDGEAGVKVLSGSNLLKVIVAKQSDKFLKGISVGGMYYSRQSWKSDNSQYELIYQLKSDVTLTSHFEDKPTLAVGSYYYADGEWSTELWDKPCVGIVFKVGRDDNDNTSYTNPSNVQGYVVALQDAPGERKSFGSSADISSFTTSTTDFKGYTACQNMSLQSNFSIDTHWACYSALHYTPEAPAASSGWYLPSLGEWNVLWQNYSAVQAKFVTAGGSDMKKSWGFYWSMSKKSDSDSQPALVDFGAWSSTASFSEKIKNNESTSYTRPIFTF